MRWILCFSLAAQFCYGEFSDHFKKVNGERSPNSSFERIDRIYLINLDERPEKLKKCQVQLSPYGIIPHRFSAVNGWSLNPQAFDELGVKFLPEMKGGEWAIHFPTEKGGAAEHDFLRRASYGKTYFSRWMTPGTIGCTLSHLSVLQDAYNSGYETIWVMEDDISVVKDPKMITPLLDQLDTLTQGEWDILFTDLDTSDQPIYGEENDFISDLKGDLWFFMRPDMDLSDRSRFAKRTVISDDFIKIGSRMRTHSMVISRRGIEKILNFEKNRHMFIPYDHELAIVPDIQMYSLRSNLITHAPSPSDTQANQKIAWQNYKQTVLNDLPQIPGWRAPQKAEKLMEFIKEVRPITSVEIGAFGGAITYPIASALNFINQGTLFAIDSWDSAAATLGMDDKKAIAWWNTINFEGIHQAFLNLLKSKQLNRCHPIHKRSNEAVRLFEDNSIDFLFIDGSTSEKGSLEDATLYLPKVKKGGYIWLNQASQLSKSPTVAFLMDECEWDKENSIGIDCVLFRKKDPKVHEHGYWIGKDQKILNEHKFDQKLAIALSDFFKNEGAKTVVDFGSGPGEYVKHLRAQEIACEGYDGNPDSRELSGGVVQWIDLSQEFDLNKRFDWVLSIEVGEHLPKQYERTYIENLHKHNAKGIVLSWALKGQGGFGHFNEQNNDYIKALMAEYGYINDLEAEKLLRERSQLRWFKNTLMVFRKI